MEVDMQSLRKCAEVPFACVHVSHNGATGKAHRGKVPPGNHHRFHPYPPNQGGKQAGDDSEEKPLQ